jgi:hypothetical protein
MGARNTGVGIMGGFLFFPGQRWDKLVFGKFALQKLMSENRTWKGRF